MAEDEVMQVDAQLITIVGNKGGFDEIEKNKGWVEIAKELGSDVQVEELRKRYQKLMQGKDEELKDDDDTKLFNVEKILGRRRKNGEIEYLLKWENYDASEATWEKRRELITTCSDLILDYEEEEKKKRELEKPDKPKKVIKKEDKDDKSEKSDRDKGKSIVRETTITTKPKENGANKRKEISGGDEDESPKKKPRAEKSEKVDKSDKTEKAMVEGEEENLGFGFDYGDEVDEILGADKKDIGLYFYVAWKNNDMDAESSKSTKDTRRKSFVLASKCNIKCPQKVIKFYESRLSFESK